MQCFPRGRSGKVTFHAHFRIRLVIFGKSVSRSAWRVNAYLGYCYTAKFISGSSLGPEVTSSTGPEKMPFHVHFRIRLVIEKSVSRSTRASCQVPLINCVTHDAAFFRPRITSSPHFRHARSKISTGIDFELSLARYHTLGFVPTSYSYFGFLWAFWL